MMASQRSSFILHIQYSYCEEEECYGGTKEFLKTDFILNHFLNKQTVLVGIHYVIPFLKFSVNFFFKFVFVIKGNCEKIKFVFCSISF